MDYLTPRVIMSDVDAIQSLADSYFQLADLPNPAGLALHLGFSSAPVMINALGNESYSIHARHVLARQVSRIEDELTTKALLKLIDVPMTKFLLSARLNMAPKTEHSVDTNKTITIISASTEPTPEEKPEVLRLEAAMSEQVEAERAVLVPHAATQATTAAMRTITVEDLI
jgi:hypothetical protein